MNGDVLGFFGQLILTKMLFKQRVSDYGLFANLKKPGGVNDNTT